MNHAPHSVQLSIREQQDLTVPAILAAMGFSLLLILFALTVEAPQQEINLGMGLCGLAYTVLNYYVFLPAFGQRRLLWWVITALNGVAVSILLMLEPFSLTGITFLFTITILVVTAILSGRWTTYAFTAILMAAQLTLQRPVFPWSREGFLTYAVLP
ncbi:MAG TPA: hypothetical protein VFF68_12595, partial [Anaerolineaceae bacterium]|nr:hypothetical protein [Anaerolineaceae bacterium]